MGLDPVSPMDRKPMPASPSPPPRSLLRRIAYPVALASFAVAEVMIAGLAFIGCMFQDYAGEAAADPVDSDGIATLACFGALVLAGVCAVVLRRRPALGSAGFAIVAVATPVCMAFDHDNVAGFLLAAWMVPGGLLFLAAVWGFVFRSVSSQPS